MRRVAEEFRRRDQRIDWCVVGEPSSRERLGDLIRVGRRGSLTGRLHVRGVQGHVAYPDRAMNPIHALAPALAELAATRWDEGNDAFPPTSFQVSNLNAGTGADNVIPGELRCDLQFPLRHREQRGVAARARRKSPERLRRRRDDRLVAFGRAVPDARRPRCARPSSPRSASTVRRDAGSQHRRRHLRWPLHRAAGRRSRRARPGQREHPQDRRVGCARRARAAAATLRARSPSACSAFAERSRSANKTRRFFTRRDARLC